MKVNGGIKMPPEMALGHMWWAYIILGVAGGIVGASLGVGGGIIMVPALVELFRYDQKVAQGTSLGVIVGIAITGVLRYHANPAINMDMGIILLIGVGAVAGALIGAKIAGELDVRWLQRIFAIVLVFSAYRIFMKSMQPNSSPASETASIMEAEAEASGPPLQNSSSAAEKSKTPEQGEKNK
jgi:uncharacterized protein